jgi:hypothetical protein
MPGVMRVVLGDCVGVGLECGADVYIVASPVVVVGCMCWGYIVFRCMCGSVLRVVRGDVSLEGCSWQCEHGGRGKRASVSIVFCVLVVSIVRGRAGLVISAPSIWFGAIVFVGGQLAPPPDLLKSALCLGPVVVFRFCFV